MMRKKLGQTLRRIAAQGIEAFYRGDLAQLVVDEIQKRGILLEYKKTSLLE